MQSYQHKRLLEEINRLDEVPEDPQTFSDWIHAKAHLTFLQENAGADEVVIYASDRCTFVHSVAVPNDKLTPIDQDDLLGWSMNPYTPIASYVTGGGRDDVWVERGLRGTRAKSLEGAVQLIFGRTFQGWTGPGRIYYELNQEYAHLTDIHWRPESRAYCRFDAHGDLEPVVSVTTRDDKGSEVALVSFKWEPLEEYLVASNALLVRMFVFNLLGRSGFSDWSRAAPQRFHDSDSLFYQRTVMPSQAGYTRGVQIVRPRRSEQAVVTAIKDGWVGEHDREYAEFIAYDWRNNRVVEISTDPSATVNYFNAKGNSLPFELSPAFFRPEVLLKYKADRDKYTVGERDVSCRAAWHLEAIDVNEAGQVHAYLCYLRELPYAEQLHWLSFNEPPKASISRRAYLSDFRAEFVDFVEPLQRVLSVVRRWHRDRVAWWTLRDERLLERVNTPLSESRDEWADAFMDLAKLVVEGFETKPIRAKLDTEQVSYEKDDRTISLLEKLLNGHDTSGDVRKLSGLRDVQFLRTKAKGHVGGSEADELAQDALLEHETFGNHFRHVCAQVANELETIEQLFS